MTYRDSLKHLIAEQQRQRLNTQQEQLIQQSLKEHAFHIANINEQFITRLRHELNKVNGQHVQRVVQFLKKL
jgi:DNA-binding response OmpR family regulator